MAWLLKPSGDKELKRMLSTLPRKVARKAISPALRKQSKAMMAAMRDNAPVDTGALKGGNWKVRVKKGSRRGFKIAFRVVLPTQQSLADGQAKSETTVAGLLGGALSGKKPKHYYPAVLEYGSKNQPPNPFMRTTANQRTSEFIADVRAAIRNNIARLAKEAAAKGESQ